MRLLPQSIERLTGELSKLPGIGPRTAERLTFYLVRSNDGNEIALGEALLDLKNNLRKCQTCFNLTDAPNCPICRESGRKPELIAVVEEPLDVIALEKTGLYQGLYHVLGGVISPLDGIGPEQLEIDSLLNRVKQGKIEEIILATNPSTESETTAMYIRKKLEPTKVRVTRLARGLPVGGNLEYADQITLGRALQGRQAF